MQLRHLKPGAKVIVSVFGVRYEGIVKGATDTELFLKGATREWVLPMSQIKEVVPKTSKPKFKI